MKIVQRDFVIGLFDKVFFKVVYPKICIVEVILLESFFLSSLVYASIFDQCIVLVLAPQLLIEIRFHAILNFVVVKSGFHDPASKHSLHILLVIILATINAALNFLNFLLPREQIFKSLHAATPRINVLWNLAFFVILVEHISLENLVYHSDKWNIVIRLIISPELVVVCNNDCNKHVQQPNFEHK